MTSRTICLSLLSGVIATSQLIADEVPAVTDPGLKQALRTVLQRRELMDPAATELSLEALKAIRYLDASGLKIKSLDGLQQCENLRELDISENEIRDLQPLTGLSKLITLRAVGNRVSDLSPLRQLTQLRELIVDRNAVKSLEPLTDCVALNRISAAENEIQDLAPISKMTQLHALLLADNQIEDLAPVAQLPKISLLDVRRNRVSRIEPLLQCDRLQWTFLQGNRVSNIESLSELGQRPPEEPSLRARWQIFLAENPCVKDTRESIATMESQQITIDFRTSGDESGVAEKQKTAVPPTADAEPPATEDTNNPKVK